MTPESAYILDCDTGIDDALAIGYLLATVPDRLLGITTVFGNVSAEVATRNTLDLLAVAGHPEIPVYQGAATSLDGAFAGGAQRVHGTNGFGGIQLPRAVGESAGESAPDFLVRAAHEHAGSLVIIAVGPLTNLAIALSIDPSIAQKIRKVVIMGGAVLHPGNATPAAEANVWHDPEAADRLLGSDMSLQLVPLDATMQQRLTRAEQSDLVQSQSRTARLIGQALDHYLGFYEGVFGREECALHDPLAAAIATETIFVQREARTTVRVQIAEGPARGCTVADMRTSHRGQVSLEHATSSVVLSTEPGFSKLLVDALKRLP